MSLIKRMRRQTAVWWNRLEDDEFGQPVYALPVEIDCRWDDEAREYIQPNGTKAVSRAVVYVDRDMRPGDKLKLCTLADLESATDSNDTNDTNDTNDSAPSVVEGAYEILGWAKNPNIRATEYLRTAYL